jgi:hypothetical protein
MILVVIRPKTRDIVMQKRVRWLSFSNQECGEMSQAVQADEKMRMGVHSMKRGIIERPCFERAS